MITSQTFIIIFLNNPFFIENISIDNNNDLVYKFDQYYIRQNVLYIIIELLYTSVFIFSISQEDIYKKWNKKNFLIF